MLINFIDLVLRVGLAVVTFNDNDADDHHYKDDHDTTSKENDTNNGTPYAQVQVQAAGNSRCEAIHRVRSPVRESAPRERKHRAQCAFDEKSGEREGNVS